MTARQLLTAAAVAAACWLAGCASRAPQPTPAPAIEPPPPVAAPVVVPAPGYEQRQAERAERAEAQGRWAEAALAWEVLSLLRPDDAAVKARLAAVRQRIAGLADEREAAAQSAQRRGDVDGAALAWLELLTLDPAHRGAADALRQIERERNRRSQVGRFARPPLTAARRPNDTASPLSPAAADAARTTNSQREHATMLARQGDIDGAIALLQDNAQWRNLPAHRALLADLYVRKAESLKASRPEAARAAVDAALAIDSRHAAALALQAQWLKPVGRPGARSTSP